jgi:hypothetical protein
MLGELSDAHRRIVGLDPPLHRRVYGGAVTDNDASSGCGWAVVAVAAIGLCYGLPLLVGAGLAAGIAWVAGLGVPAALLVGGAIWVALRRARARQGCPAPLAATRNDIDPMETKERS